MIIKQLEAAPRPNMYRERWMSLNGEWEFAFDDADAGLDEGWFEPGRTFDRLIRVPFCYQSKRSGIGDPEPHEVVWYRKNVKVPDLAPNEHVWIHFGAVDYKADIWIDGRHITQHTGGHTGFSLKVPKSSADAGAFELVVRAEDRFALDQPRGKQIWSGQPERCWYTATTGIWQRVWMEVTGETRLERVRITPDVDRHEALVEGKLSRPAAEGELNWTMYFNDRQVSTGRQAIAGGQFRFVVAVEDQDPIDTAAHLWSPQRPNLFFLELELVLNGRTEDRLVTYFGMRKIETRGGKVLLNHFPLYQKLVLDQGYWPDTLMTPPDDEALLNDVLFTKKMGFNGVRKHQKIEDPKYLFYADVHGLLVWNEMPSMYHFTVDGMKALVREWEEAVEQVYNHPSVIVHVPLNESWGVKDILHDVDQQRFAVSLYHLTKALDPTRLVSTNDGWETVVSDLCGIHDYEKSGERLYEKYKDRDKLLAWTAVGKMIYADGHVYSGEPVLLSEFGGIALQDGKERNWGYNDKAADGEELLERLGKLLDAVMRLDYIEGYCYTQLTDVEQETNGLLYPDRTPKVPFERIKELIDRSR
jgi:beta-galactosidase/beta-glucuronidase